MGMDYTLYVVAAPPAWNYRPDASTGARIAEELAALGWVDPSPEGWTIAVPNAAGRLRSSPTSFSRLQEDLTAALGGHRSVVLEAQTVPQEKHWPDGAIDSEGRSRMYQFEKVSRLEARYCESLSLVWTETVCTVPGDNVARMPCPVCSADVLASAEWVHGGRAVPQACPSCGAAVPPDQLVGGAHDVMTGEVHQEVAPVFQFAICVAMAPGALPEHEPVAVEEALLAMLASVTGARWRALASVG